MKDDIYGTFKKRNADDSYNGANSNIQPKDWATGHWENLPDANGRATLIRDTQHLREECDRRGVMAKGLLKPKSMGKGYEMSSKPPRKYFFM